MFWRIVRRSPVAFTAAPRSSFAGQMIRTPEAG
jgi:hypothetical protein